ncbi:MAG: LysE family translocator [Micrococcaceae bacterium]
MEISLIAQFWLVAVLFVLTPGADWAFAMSAGVGQRSPLPSVLGLLSGHLIAIGVVAAGVGTLVAQAPAAMTVLTVGGAGYLLWLGVGMLRSAARDSTRGVSRDGEGAAVVVRSSSVVRQLGTGAGVSLLNPKVILLLLALLPQFVDRSGALPFSVQMGLLGSVHVASCAVVYLFVGYGARRVLRTRPRAARWVTLISGVAMIGIATVLLGEKLLPLL